MDKDKLTVEIFQDFHTRNIAIDPAITSLEGISRIASAVEFDLIRSNRRIKIASEHEETVNARRINWNILPADINIVLSERPIDSEPGIQVYGHSLTEYGPGIGSRGLVVSSHENDQMVAITSHELCHALNMKHAGAAWDGAHHCNNEYCLLHKTVNRSTQVIERIPISWTEKVQRRVNGPVYETHRALKNQSPCSECIGQIGAQAYWLLEAKKGKAVPPQLVFPQM